MRVLASTTAVLTACATTLVLTAPGALARAPRVDLQPEALSRGADISVPHVEDGVLVDGSTRIDLPGDRAILYGASGKGFVLGTSSADGMTARRIVRVSADGTVTTLIRRLNPYVVRLSEDGRRLVSATRAGATGQRIRVWSARTGDLKRSRVFAGYPHGMGADGHRVLLGSWDRGVFWWNLRTGRTRSVTPRPGSVASIDNDLLASYTGDPYDGGCTVVTRLSRPGRALWRSCSERVDALSPDGTRMATTDILSDGIGPGMLVQRTIRGDVIATYTTAWFGRIGWEDPTTMLLEVNGERRSATVRCAVADCENATDPVRVTQP